MQFYRKITGQRLYLSPFDAADTAIQAQWTEWMNDRGVSDTFDGHHQLVNIAVAKKTLESLKGYFFAIVLLEGDAHIGHISLHDIDHLHRHAFLGIVIGDSARRGNGYGAEAIRLVLDYGFNTLNLHSIMLSVHADNHPGIACYKKAGFQYAGRRREWVFKEGQYVDLLYMEILDREFNAQT